MNQQPYRIGCPMWGNRHWKDTFFPSGAEAEHYLPLYSQVFNTVEGNTTFYGVPNIETAKKWAEQASDDFRFCFKLPQRVTHTLKLRHAEKDTAAYFKALEPLAEQCGPFLLQLPPSFSPESLADLRRFIAILPQDFAYTVEVRHLSFFHDYDADDALCDLLRHRDIDRVIFDTRPLFSARPTSDAVRDAQAKKPRVPANTYALSKHPTLRFIGHPDPARSHEYFKPWLRKVATWITEGKEPYVFLHTPDNADAPQLAQDFHQGLMAFFPNLPELASPKLSRLGIASGSVEFENSHAQGAVDADLGDVSDGHRNSNRNSIASAPFGMSPTEGELPVPSHAMADESAELADQEQLKAKPTAEVKSQAKPSAKPSAKPQAKPKSAKSAAAIEAQKKKESQLDLF